MKIDQLINDLADDFCRTPLPESVCADRIACEHGAKNRSGTNLLTVVEARQVLDAIIRPRIAPLLTEHAALTNMCKGSNEDARVLKLLVTAGYVTETKIEEARAFLGAVLFRINREP
jgi:hypothetical protein